MNLFDTGVRPAIDEWLLQKSREVRDYGDYWSASSAGYCQRKVIFERLGVPHVEKEDDARKQRVFTAGHLFHDWIQGITKEAGLSIASEVELQHEELMVRGHFDDLVLVTDQRELADIGAETLRTGVTPPIQRLILYDYKTVNSRSFMWAKKNGNAMNYSHRLQLGTYMYMLRRGRWTGGEWHKANFRWNPKEDLTEARILKIEKDTLMMMEQQLLWDTQLESDVLSYWSSLNAHWKAKTLPQCSCADHDNGFMAKEKWNNYYYEGEPCSLAWYNKFKETQNVTA